MDLLAGGVAALIDQARAGHGGRLHRLLVHGVSDRGVAVGRHCGPNNACSTCTAPAIRIWRSPRASAPCRRQSPRSRTRRCVTSTRSCCWRRSTACRQETLGRPPRRLDVRGARDAQPASGAVVAVLGLVRRLGAARAPDRRHAHGLRLDLPHGDHRVQRALDPQLANPGDRRRHPAYCLHPGDAPRHQAAGARARRGADRSADRADRGRRGAHAGDHAPRVADRAQC